MVGIALVAGLLAAGIGWFLYSSQKPRTLRVRVYTDYAYRQKNANWEQLVRDRIAGLNRIYEEVGIRWELESMDQADPTASMRDLDLRRRRLAEQPVETADLLLGISAQAAGPLRASVVPFTHAVMVMEELTMDANALARELSHIFGAPKENAYPADGQLSETARRLVRRLRNYDFEHGTEELAGSGGDRVVIALTEAYRNLAPNPNARAHEVVAASLISEHRIQPAIAHLREALKLDPKDASVRLTLAAALAEDGDVNGALATVREGVAANPGNQRLTAAAAALDAKVSHQAEATLESTELVARYPKDPELNALLGWLFLPEAGLIGQSSIAFLNARNADSDTPSALRGLERAATAKRQALMEVERRREGVRQRPDNPEAYFNLGVSQLIAGDFDGAQEAFQHATALNPNFGKAHVNLALIHWLKREYAAADREAAIAHKSGEEPSKELVRVIRKGLGQ